MSSVTIECASCAWESEIDEALLGRRVKCPKCKESFVAEKSGAYDLVEPPRAKKAPAPILDTETEFDEVPKKQKENKPAAAGISDEEKKDLLSNMEKWAEE